MKDQCSKWLRTQKRAWADKAGISVTQLNEYLRGERTITAREAARLAEHAKRIPALSSLTRSDIAWPEDSVDPVVLQTRGVYLRHPESPSDSSDRSQRRRIRDQLQNRGLLLQDDTPTTS